MLKKMTYLLTETIYPYFREILVKDIQKSDSVLEYDETTNNGGVKELQLRLRYWSKERKQVVTRHLRTYYMGHATSEDLSKKILQSIEDKDFHLRDC
jgi:hypothetical protein